jgi:hypothetical protein
VESLGHRGYGLMQKLFALGISLVALAATTAGAYEKPTYPRTAGLNMGSPFNYDEPAYKASLSKLDVMILNTYPGNKPIEGVVRDIKAVSPKALVFLYVNSNEHGDAALYGGGTTWDAYRTKLDSMKWWLYSAGPSGTKVKSSYGTGYYIINNTPQSAKDSGGKSAIDWITRYYVDSYYKPNPSIDGFFMDNVFWKPRVTGDWNRDGKADAKDDPQAATWLRQGYAQYFKVVKGLMPGKFQIGNITDWGQDKAVITEYKGMANGGVLEGMIGETWSAETYAGWSGMMTQYRRIMAALAEPKLAIFSQIGKPNDYQGFRYGFASCLLDDAYFSFTDEAKGYKGVVWFDEYDVDLGAAVSQPATKAWTAGVYRRDFEKGIVLVNPKGNGAKEVTLETDFVKIKGKQSTTVNDGTVVRKVKLADRDGLVLLRKNVARRPKAPAAIVIEN